MAGRKSDFTLPTLDDLFSTQEMRDDAKLAKIRDIPLELIDDFPDHPFKVRDDEDMMQLVESVKERGVITPATVRQKEDGRYELISGHRRKRACELAGFETLRCEVVDLTRDEATILMVESNFQRSQILPSEKAFAYKMRLEAMKRQGERKDLTCAPVGHKLDGTKSRDILSDVYSHILDEDRRLNAQRFEETFYQQKKPSAVSGATVEPTPATPPVQEPQAITEEAMLNYMVQNPDFLQKFKVLLGVGN